MHDVAMCWPCWHVTTDRLTYELYGYGYVKATSTLGLAWLRCVRPLDHLPTTQSEEKGPGQLTIITCQLSCYIEVWPASVPSTRHVHMFEHRSSPVCKISLRRLRHWHPRPVPLLLHVALPIPASKSPASHCTNMPFVRSVTRPRLCCRMSALSPRKPSR